MMSQLPVCLNMSLIELQCHGSLSSALADSVLGAWHSTASKDNVMDTHAPCDKADAADEACKGENPYLWVHKEGPLPICKYCRSAFSLWILIISVLHNTRCITLCLKL